jgi:hypothetical protein
MKAINTRKYMLVQVPAALPVVCITPKLLREKNVPVLYAELNFNEGKWFRVYLKPTLDC